MTDLRAAACRGDILELQILLDDGQDFHSSDRNGDTALHLAAFEGHLPIVQELIQIGSEVNAKNRNGQTALHLSAIRGHTDIVMELLHSGGERSAQTKYSGMSALHLASHNGHLDVVKLLLKTGGDDTLDYIGKPARFYSTSEDIREAFSKHEHTEKMMNKEIPQPTFGDDQMESTRTTADRGSTLTTDMTLLTTAKIHSNSLMVSKTFLDFPEGKRRRSRSHSLEKIKYLHEKEKSAEEIPPFERPTSKIKRRRSRSHSVHKVKPSETESETKLLSRPQPIQIEESEEIQELEVTKGRPLRKEPKTATELPPLTNPTVIPRKKQTTKGKPKNSHVLIDKKFQFSEKHKQRMKESVFDRLAKK